MRRIKVLLDWFRKLTRRNKQSSITKEESLLFELHLKNLKEQKQLREVPDNVPVENVPAETFSELRESINYHERKNLRN